MSQEKEKKYLCNYCFIAECHDCGIGDLEKTKCHGVSEKDSTEGRACGYWDNKDMSK